MPPPLRPPLGRGKARLTYWFSAYLRAGRGGRGRVRPPRCFAPPLPAPLRSQRTQLPAPLSLPPRLTVPRAPPRSPARAPIQNVTSAASGSPRAKASAASASIPAPSGLSAPAASADVLTPTVPASLLEPVSIPTLTVPPGASVLAPASIPAVTGVPATPAPAGSVTASASTSVPQHRRLRARSRVDWPGVRLQQ